MAVFSGNGIGDVGERGCAFVGGDDEVGVIIVPTHNALRGLYRIAIYIIGDIEQAAQEGLVGFDARFLKTRRAARRQALGKKTALRAHRHDDSVLDLLRFHKVEHFGPEIVAPVTPAQSSARNRAKAQMHAFDLRAGHPDFAIRLRCGQFSDRVRVNLE